MENKGKALLFIFIGLLSMSFLGDMRSQKGDDILGLWLTEEKDGKIQVFKVGNEYRGKVVWANKIYGPNGEKLRDTKNPDPKKRSRILEGAVILEGLVFDGDDTWDDGEIYDSTKGNTYSCNVTMEDGNLVLRGYIGISLFGQSTTWTRIKK